MPRQAHGKSLNPAKASKRENRKPQKGQYLNALEIAEKQNPARTKIRQHRLGEVEDSSDHPQSRADLDGRVSKKQKVSIAPDDDEEVMVGSDSEGNEWHMGVGDEDEDSEIDSEAAFGDSDEERFAGYTFRGGTTERQNGFENSQSHKRKRAQEIDLLETVDDYALTATGSEGSDAEDEDDLGEEAVDLATALDLNDEDEQRQQEQATQKSKSNPVVQNGVSDSEDSGHHEGHESDGSGHEDEGSQLSISDGEDVGGHSRLRIFVEGLEAPTVSRPQKFSDSTGLPNKPSEFGLASSKLSASDLLQYVKDPRHRQSLKILDNSEKAGPASYKGGIPGKLEPTLAKRQQDRIDRLAAYDKSKETMNRWIDTVKQNRRAEHISFPLPDHDALSAQNTKQLGPTSASHPMTSLESTIQEIMHESGFGTRAGQSAEAHERAFEELQERKMPIEEVQTRRAELRRTRELMFREEIRARRIKKIKSKAYRRVHRKEREKGVQGTRADLLAMGLVNSDDEREQNERRRAEERMGARHRESKWAKGVKSTGRALWDEDARHAVSELARRDEELRRRIEGRPVHDSDLSDQQSMPESDDDTSDINSEFEGFGERLDILAQEPNAYAASRLGSMAFMQKAEAARKSANDAEIKGIRKILHNDVQEDGARDPEPVGRIKYGMQKTANLDKPPARGTDRSDFEEKNSEDEEEVEQRPEPDSIEQSREASKEDKAAASGVVHDERSRQPRGPTPRLDTKPGAIKSVKQHYSKPFSPSQPQKQPRLEARAEQQPMSDTTSDFGSDDEAEAAPLDLTNTESVAKGLFAGDDLVAHDFKTEKKAIVAEEGDQVVDNSLPGWGSWAGAGISKREQRRQERARGRLMTTIKGVVEEQRKDSRLERVIINEKVVKKNGKYLASELPHPFESREQYERSLRLPIGPEWTTKSTFQDATKPRVLMRQGIIRPIAKPIA